MSLHIYLPFSEGRTKFKSGHKPAYRRRKILHNQAVKSKTPEYSGVFSLRYTGYMEPKKPRSKTLLFAVLVMIIVLMVGFYYVAAIRNSDNRPAETEQAS